MVMLARFERMSYVMMLYYLIALSDVRKEIGCFVILRSQNFSPFYLPSFPTLLSYHSKEILRNVHAFELPYQGGNLAFSHL